MPIELYFIYSVSHFQGKRAMFSITTGAPKDSFTTYGPHGDINILLWPLQVITVVCILKAKWTIPHNIITRTVCANTNLENDTFQAKFRPLLLTNKYLLKLYQTYIISQSGILRFVGLEVLAPFISYSPQFIPHEGRAKILKQWADRMANVFRERPLRFLPISKFSSKDPENPINGMELTAESIRELQEDDEHGLTIGHHLGRRLPLNSMTRNS